MATTRNLISWLGSFSLAFGILEFRLELASEFIGWEIRNMNFRYLLTISNTTTNYRPRRIWVLWLIETTDWVTSFGYLSDNLNIYIIIITEKIPFARTGARTNKSWLFRLAEYNGCWAQYKSFTTISASEGQGPSWLPLISWFFRVFPADSRGRMEFLQSPFFSAVALSRRPTWTRPHGLVRWKFCWRNHAVWLLDSSSVTPVELPFVSFVLEVWWESTTFTTDIILISAGHRQDCVIHRSIIIIEKYLLRLWAQNQNPVGASHLCFFRICLDYSRIML